jgi:hypothetical protein
MILPIMDQAAMEEIIKMFLMKIVVIIVVVLIVCGFIVTTGYKNKSGKK